MISVIVTWHFKYPHFICVLSPPHTVFIFNSFKGVDLFCKGGSCMN